MDIKTQDDITLEEVGSNNSTSAKKMWVSVESLNTRLNTVMNVRQDETAMRRLIIDIQKELKR